MAIHVYQVNDLQNHEVDDAEGLCECLPSVEYVGENGLPYDDGPVITHNAFDLRELFEKDGPWS